MIFEKKILMGILENRPESFYRGRTKNVRNLWWQNVSFKISKETGGLNILTSILCLSSEDGQSIVHCLPLTVYSVQYQEMVYIAKTLSSVLSGYIICCEETVGVFWVHWFLPIIHHPAPPKRKCQSAHWLQSILQPPIENAYTVAIMLNIWRKIIHTPGKNPPP